MTWTSKIGNTAKPLVLALTHNGALVNFSSLTGPGGIGAPQLRMRLRWQTPLDAVSFDLVASSEEGYNAQKVFSQLDFALLQAGVYLCEVDARTDGNAEVSFPDDGYFTIEFLRGV